MNTQDQGSHRRIIKQCNIVMIIMLLTSLLAVGCTAPATPPPSVQPALLALVEQQPDSNVRVIVQKRSAGDSVEQLVTKIGGVVIQDLSLINGFAAEVPAAAIVRLAQSNEVRWISLDAPMRQSQVNAVPSSQVFTTWATALGTRGSTSFDYPGKMVDSALGPNGTYSVANKKVAYLGGFVPQITDNAYAITKMEVVLHAYATSTVATGSVKITANIAGQNYSAIVLGSQIFAGRIGQANAGHIYVDITSTKPTWDWNDFANQLEIKIEQQTAQPVYFDAIGLRVTSVLSPVFTTWANALGTVETNTFAYPGYLIDSVTGPAATYGYGGRTKASFVGFEAEASPGFVIRKVEAVVYGYAVRPFAKAIEFTPHIDGLQIAESIPNGHIFDNRIGAANAGPIFVDITGAYAWKWSDFDKYLELAIDQSALQAEDTVYYDAVGLRVWTKPGSDPSGNTPADTAQDNAAIDLGRQVNVYNKVIRAEDLWNENNQLLGKGVAVAVVDSGVYKSGDLSDLKFGVNFNRGYHDSKDRYGHGTYVAGVIAGNGRQSHGIHIGVAPKARIVNVRVSDDTGKATASDVVAGLQWVYENGAKYNIRVVNLSLNSSVPGSYLTDPLCAAVEMLWLKGIVVVVSAGNNGTADLYPPANDPFIITVGATDDAGTATLADDTVASFSAYGTIEGGYAKPDVVTPGRNIIAFLPGNQNLTIANGHPSNRVDKEYFRMSGTSMSAPMVSGAVALLLQNAPALTPDQVKYRLLVTANKNWPGYNSARAGAGYLDIYAAVHSNSTERANIGVPVSRWLWESLASTVWGSVNWNSVNWNSVNWNSVNWNSVNWNSVNWNSVNWNSVNWNSVNWNSDYWGDDGMGAAGATVIPAVERLLELLRDDELHAQPTDAAGNTIYLPIMSR